MSSIENISLSGRKTVVVNEKLSWKERLYLIAVVQGMWITIKHFFKKKVTIQYPEQQRVFSPVYRGRHSLMKDEQGRERCTACGLCALACPAEAITIKAAERQPGEEHLYREEKYAAVYEINMLRCIFCGLCEEACPKQAIYLTKSNAMVKPSVKRKDFIYGKDRLLLAVGQTFADEVKSTKNNKK